MLAAQYSKFGGPEVIKINEVDIPRPGRKQVLVEVHAASINPIDTKIREGRFKLTPLMFPVTIGGNFSGVVIGLGEGVRRYKIGDEVWGQAIILNEGSGATAQYLVANVRNIAHKPQNLNHIKAASLPLVGISAIQSLEDIIKLRKKDKILILGGAGGIGSIAVKLAKHMGAYVITTVSKSDMRFARSLGADEVYDYNKIKLADKISNLDVVFDTTGADITEEKVKVLREGGMYTSMTGFPADEFKKKYKIKAVAVMTRESSENLNRLGKYVESGIISAKVSRVFNLSKTKMAYKFQEKENTRGKVVIKIK